MRKGVTAHADATREVIEQGGGRYQAAFVTLTYREVDAWRPEHVTAYLNHARNWLARRGVTAHFQWVLELQERGAPHYHLVVWLPRNIKLPKPDNAGWWHHGMSNIKRARRPVGYLVKYVSKGNNSLFAMPKGARLFGTGGSPAAALARHRANLPTWLRKRIPEESRAARIPHVGWVCEQTGEVFVSPYVVRWGHDEDGNAQMVCMDRTSPEEPAWAFIKQLPPLRSGGTTPQFGNFEGGSEPQASTRISERDVDLWHLGQAERETLESLENKHFARECSPHGNV